MKLKSLKAEKKSFLRFRNDHGEVVACLNVGGADDKTIPVGVAFCNPKDFNLRRKIRTQKGHGLASSRADKALGEKVPATLVMEFEDTLGSIGEEKLLEHMTEVITDYLSRGLFGFKTYASERKDGEFVAWFVPFMKALRGEEAA
jgi:hypothetical protein